MQEQNIHKTEATHYVADFYQIEDQKSLDDMDFCAKTVKGAVEISGCGILNIYQHKFSPQGLSITATLSESHCTIHTWPERGYCAIDLYGCGRANLRAGIDFFTAQFKPGKIRLIELQRGHEHENRPA